MPAYFTSDSMFCMPSVIEPLGIAAVEASLFRLPMIATRIGGLFETVTDGETGILVAPRDPVALAGTVRRLFGDPESARRMGLAGFNRNCNVFDWDEVGRRLRSIAHGMGLAVWIDTAAASADQVPQPGLALFPWSGSRPMDRLTRQGTVDGSLTQGRGPDGPD
jgi:hypothetical protein